MKNTIFTGMATAIVTPMTQDGSIDYEALGRFIEFQIENGINALVVMGTTGENATIEPEDQKKVIAYTVEKVAKRIPVIAGTGSNDTGYAIELSKAAEKAGADALLQVTPYYNKTSQRGLIAHFNAIANAVSIPIILYNVPSRTGMNIALETYIELAKTPNIVAVKEASGNLSLVAKIAAHTDLDIYSGNDDQILPVLSLGGKGVISVSSNVIPREKHNMVAYYLEGKTAEALELQKKYLDMENALFMDVNPIPVKEAMNLCGMNAGTLRMPLMEMTDANKATLRASMEKLGLIK